MPENQNECCNSIHRQQEHDDENLAEYLKTHKPKYYCSQYSDILAEAKVRSFTLITNTANLECYLCPNWYLLCISWYLLLGTSDSLKHTVILLSTEKITITSAWIPWNQIYLHLRAMVIVNLLHPISPPRDSRVHAGCQFSAQLMEVGCKQQTYCIFNFHPCIQLLYSSVVDLLNCTSDRLAAVQIDLGGRHILVMTVYLPFDDGNEDCLADFIACLGSIEAVISDSDIEAIYVLGDFNAHCDRYYDSIVKVLQDAAKKSVCHDAPLRHKKVLGWNGNQNSCRLIFAPVQSGTI
ncbi:unnamed protein product [Leptidea sinapis]|uniref:Endonuclease/exonuclease/phosphatase domain-containing protein n=1 Tax=Leptidea sinapis TaxID=189913 RepID=A0A5E4PNI0_9NEOP|nr:unnamed protein product [Leptidea sinapis]